MFLINDRTTLNSRERFYYLYILQLKIVSIVRIHSVRYFAKINRWSINCATRIFIYILVLYAYCMRCIFFFFLRRRRRKEINRLSHDNICFIINVYNSMLSHGFKLHEDYYCIFYLLYGIEKQINNYRIMETCVFRENNCILFKRKYPIYNRLFATKDTSLFHLFRFIPFIPLVYLEHRLSTNNNNNIK